MIRTVQVTATGQYCAPALIDSHFADDGTAWADAVAVALGLPAGSLTVVNSASDPRSGTLLAEPVAILPPPVTPPPTLSEQLAPVLMAIANDPALQASTKASLTQAATILAAH